MSKEVRALEPKVLWNHFADLNAVPRPSKREHRAVEFMKKFGESLNLETIVDEVGNVIIKKPATKGMEDRTPIIIQGHVDMVAQKNRGVDFDFDKEGIKMYVDDDWVKAEGTTLGADNGIGVATAMAILSSTDIPHPAIEGLFTIDEETGMTGAMALQPGFLDGKIMLNLDSEDETEITIGCAGGVDVNVRSNYIQVPTREGALAYEVGVKGLKGGHSGMDINLGRGNANKLMNRLLWHAADQFNIKVATINGGGLRNAIPRESHSVVIVPKKFNAKFKKYVKALSEELKLEHKSTDPNMVVEIKAVDTPKTHMRGADQKNLLNAIYSAWNGIFRMSPDVEGLVQTSNNVARVLVEDGNIEIDNLTRGSVDSEKMDLANTLKANFSQIGGEVTYTGEYPGWAPDTQASINQVMIDNFEKNFNNTPHVTACHAGLECGIIKKAYPNVEMISFGPNIRGAHSPDERVQISSVQRFYGLVLDTLANAPKPS